VTTQLGGASFLHAQLQGASLTMAQLDGASLDDTQLQGARLGEVQLRGAWLTGTFVWRADTSAMEAEGAYVDKIVAERKYEGLDCKTRSEPCDWSGETYAALGRLIEDKVPAGERQKEALAGIRSLDPEKPEPPSGPWDELEKNRSTLDEYRAKRAGIFREIGCEQAWAPHVSRSLSRGLEARLGRKEARKLAEDFLDETKCPGARGLTEREKSDLREIRDGNPPTLAAPKPKAKAAQ